MQIWWISNGVNKPGHKSGEGQEKAGVLENRHNIASQFKKQILEYSKTQILENQILKYSNTQILEYLKTQILEYLKT